MKVKEISLFAMIVFIFIGCTRQTPSVERPDIIPIPYKSEMTGGNFKVNGKTKVLMNSSDNKVKNVAEALQSTLSAYTKRFLSVSQAGGKQPKNSIFLKIDETLSEDLGKEGYKLSVKSSRIEISAPEPAGLFYGVQTLYQLLPPGIYSSHDSLADADLDLKIPCIEVTDKPAFPWRGMHLDVSRHFFQKEFIEKYIDLIALHKMNVFHWHLTDDNGWRIQIDRYPLLTEVAAWRADREGIPWTECQPRRPGEPATYGGFYSKEDIREIVEYAKQRFVTIIPEIEMPGHTSEVFAAYPEFSCTGKRTTVQTGSYWPNNDIFCAGKDETFGFLENVLDEVMELFPSEYIHIGGDEADKTAWKSCSDCQARIRKEGLSGVDELQSYFVKRIEKYLKAKGKRMIGWDEILEGGIAPDATVMSWRGYEGGIDAARQGHQVVMCPGSYCYFDHYQADPEFQPEAIGGLTTVKKVYSFFPIPSELSRKEGELILGGQGNVWTEYISTTSHAEYMALPRMTALAEVLWSPVNLLDWDNFRSRLQTQFSRFDRMDVNYSQGSGKVDVTPLMNMDNRPYTLRLETEATGTSIYYTLDGNTPDRSSFIYRKPINIDHDGTLKAVAFKDDKQLEKPAEYEIEYHRIVGKNIFYLEKFSERYPGNGPQTLNDGLSGSLNYNDGYWQGFNGNNVDVVIDLGEDFTFKTISATFLLDQKRLIFIPETVNYYLSEDGERFQKIASVTHNISLNNERVLTNDFTAKLNKPLKVKYLRVEAINIGVCPEWHPEKGQKAWLFIDEIVVK
ncbi:MAG: glycoside hydrolase family 20 protein [Bacteroidales bacterium]|nr:glycoside hydrolase family 20 protein [Bacteroidales bacterium]